MHIRVLDFVDGQAVAIDSVAGRGWTWVDIVAGPEDVEQLRHLAETLALDPLSVVDTVSDPDDPKVDDFGNQILLVLHGLAEDEIDTREVDCFIQPHRMTTIHRGSAPAVERLWQTMAHRPALAGSSPSELAALLADALTRRLLAVVDAFDTRVDEMVERALDADASLIADVTAVRADLLAIRRIVHPQREALDLMRSTRSPLVTDLARRRFSDVFDVSMRCASELDAARAALAETLDAYRGAEARVATDVAKVLTVYAAIVLPLSLIAGFFGMNFQALPWTDKDWGWIAVSALMGAVALVSLGVFIALGWIRRPSGARPAQRWGEASPKRHEPPFSSRERCMRFPLSPCAG